MWDTHGLVRLAVQWGSSVLTPVVGVQRRGWKLRINWELGVRWTDGCVSVGVEFATIGGCVVWFLSVLVMLY